MENKPNIILIMTDEMRGDCMGYAGHPDVKTPYLDSLAQDGIWYPNAYSACPTCIPARAVLHTGLSPQHTGRVGYEDRIDWNYGCTMAGELKKAGYYTECVGKMHVHPLRNLLGFDHVMLHDGYLHKYRSAAVLHGEVQWEADDYLHWLRKEKGADCDIIDTGLDCNSWLSRPWIYEEKYHPTNWVTSESIDFLRRRDPRMPFFLMMSYVRPHAPYDAPQPYFDLYRNQKLRPPLAGDWDDEAFRKKIGRRFDATTGPQDPELIRQQMIGYYACITHIDHQIGRFLIKLQEHDLLRNTVILFTSDHGEMLSDHALIRKSRPYQGSAHIPLLINGPQHLIGNPRTDDSLVELRDIMPTVLSFAGIPAPSHLDGTDIRNGISREFLHGEHIYGEQQASTHFIVTKTDKYIWFSQTGKEQYFDLVNDPGETHNAVADPENGERIAALRQLLIQDLADREEGFVQDGKLVINRPIRASLSNATARNCD